MTIYRSLPLTNQLVNTLLERIQEGKYAAGARFPSESELCNEFGVSRATVRTALASLASQGMLVKQAGVGTFLAGQHRLESGLEQLESVLTVARRNGFDPQIAGLMMEVMPADETLAEILQLEPGSLITRVARAILVEGTPSSYHEDYLPERTIPAEELDGFSGSVLDMLVTRLNPPVVQARTEITAMNANLRLCAELGVDEGRALILLKETLYDETGKIVGYSENFFVPDRFRLDVMRKR